MNIQKLSTLTSWLVGFVAFIAFALSYVALWAVAADNGVPWYLAWLWPFLIDFALVVFSLAVIRANLLGERAYWPWALVIAFSLMTIGFNLAHAAPGLLSYAVAFIPPLALVLSFETLTAMLRSSIKGQSLSDELAALEAQIADRVIERDNVEASVRQLQGQADSLQETIAGANIRFTKGTFDRHQREVAVLVLSKLGIGIGEQAEMLSVSDSTIKNDRKVWNGELR